MTARTTLTVAGSDPGGGAGVQADLKTFGALGTFGTSVLTALTAQSTAGVFGVHPVPAEFVRRQLDVLLDDVVVHAAKTGMLGGADVVRTVAAVLRERAVGPVVVDPVMVSTSGDRLLDADAVAAVRDDLVPLADLVTPNVAEAAVLLGAEEARDVDEAVVQAEDLLRRTGTAVLLKGGHLGGAESVDVLATDGATLLSRRPRVATTATHGTGCTLSAALAAAAALGTGGPGDWGPALDRARDYLQAALTAGRDLHVGGAAGGPSHGPLDHFHGGPR